MNDEREPEEYESDDLSLEEMDALLYLASLDDALLDQSDCDDLEKQFSDLNGRAAYYMLRGMVDGFLPASQQLVPDSYETLRGESIRPGQSTVATHSVVPSSVTTDGKLWNAKVLRRISYPLVALALVLCIAVPFCYFTFLKSSLSRSEQTMAESKKASDGENSKSESGVLNDELVADILKSETVLPGTMVRPDSIKGQTNDESMGTPANAGSIAKDSLSQVIAPKSAMTEPMFLYRFKPRVLALSASGAGNDAFHEQGDWFFGGAQLPDVGQGELAASEGIVSEMVRRTVFQDRGDCLDDEVTILKSIPVFGANSGVDLVAEILNRRGRWGYRDFRTSSFSSSIPQPNFWVLSGDSDAEDDTAIRLTHFEAPSLDEIGKAGLSRSSFFWRFDQRVSFLVKIELDLNQILVGGAPAKWDDNSSEASAREGLFYVKSRSPDENISVFSIIVKQP